MYFMSYVLCVMLVVKEVYGHVTWDQLMNGGQRDLMAVKML